MKVVIAQKPQPEEQKVELKLEDINGTIVVTDTDGWFIVGFKVIDGKVSLVRYGSLPDTLYNVTEEDNCRISETEE